MINANMKVATFQNAERRWQRKFWIIFPCFKASLFRELDAHGKKCL